MTGTGNEGCQSTQTQHIRQTDRQNLTNLNTTVKTHLGHCDCDSDCQSPCLSSVSSSKCTVILLASPLPLTQILPTTSLFPSCTYSAVWISQTADSNWMKLSHVVYIKAVHIITKFQLFGWPHSNCILRNRSMSKIPSLSHVNQMLTASHKLLIQNWWHVVTFCISIQWTFMPSFSVIGGRFLGENWRPSLSAPSHRPRDHRKHTTVTAPCPRRLATPARPRPKMVDPTNQNWQNDTFQMTISQPILNLQTLPV